MPESSVSDENSDWAQTNNEIFVRTKKPAGIWTRNHLEQPKLRGSVIKAHLPHKLYFKILLMNLLTCAEAFRENEVFGPWTKYSVYLQKLRGSVIKA